MDEMYERILGDAWVIHFALADPPYHYDISVLADLTNTDQDTVKKVVKSLHTVPFLSPPRMAVSIGTMPRFLILSSLKYKR